MFFLRHENRRPCFFKDMRTEEHVFFKDMRTGEHVFFKTWEQKNMFF